MDYGQLYDEYGDYNILYNQLNLPSPSVDYAWRKTKLELQKEVGKQIEEKLAKKPEVGVCDLGCGNGALLMRLATEYKGRSVKFVGVDLAKSFVAFANQAVKAKDLDNCRFEQRDMEKEDLPAGVDIVINSEVLEHLVDPGKFVEKIYATLNSGGILAMSTPNATNWIKYPFGFVRDAITRFQKNELKKTIAEKDRRFVDAEEEQHIHVFGQKELKDLLKSKGLEVYKIKRSTTVFGGPLLDKYPLLFAKVIMFDWVCDKLGVTQIGWDSICFAKKP